MLVLGEKMECGVFEMVRYKMKKYSRRYDHSEIRKLFRDGLSNRAIAQMSGYSVGYIRELRWKYSPVKWY